MIKKKKLIDVVAKKIGNIEDVLSVSFVGSFLTKKNFSDIANYFLGLEEEKSSGIKFFNK